MTSLTAFLQWLIQYTIGNGFWHFVACLLIVRAITGITTLVRVVRDPIIDFKSKK